MGMKELCLLNQPSGRHDRKKCALFLAAVLQGSNLANEEARRSTSPVKDYAPLPGVSLLAGAKIEF